jgi:MYXO-CTERM domain-containing protein
LRPLAALLLSSVAWAHGGLPVSTGVLRQGETMYIPVVYWGLWVGTDNGPWTWICEEEMNPFRLRKYALSTDGSFYITDSRGLTLSTDQGCTWTPATGEIAALKTSDIAADPVDGATAWATTTEVQTSPDGGSSANNGLFVTHDHGATFARVPALDGNGRRFESVKLAAGGIYVVSAGLSAPFNVTLHHSADGGGSFDARPINFTVGGTAPYAGEVMAIDPRDPNGLWLRLFVTAAGDGGAMPLQVLVRSSDAGMNVTEVQRMVGEMTPSGATRGIDGVAVDGKRGRVFVATAKGLYAGDDPGGAATVTIAPTGGLTIAQCVEVHGDAIYVCSSNYSPDFKALARSDDGGQTFHQVLSYQATEGPVDCPKGTPVGDLCPGFWEMYASQLGIDNGFIDGGAGADGGSGGGGGSCSCSLGGRPLSPLLWVAGLALLGSYLLYRRRRA